MNGLSNTKTKFWKVLISVGRWLKNYSLICWILLKVGPLVSIRWRVEFFLQNSLIFPLLIYDAFVRADAFEVDAIEGESREIFQGVHYDQSVWGVTKTVMGDLFI